MHSLYALEFAQNGQTVTVVAEDRDRRINLVGLPLEKDIGKAGSQD